jgi:phosphatidylglycerophosphatase A
VRTLAKWLAMLGPVAMPPGPRATYGSAVVALIGYFLPVPPVWMFCVLLALGTLVAVWAAGEAEHVLGHDANPIVIDEAVGQTLALILVPHNPMAFFVSFALFRVLDVIKPLGAYQAQNLPGGWGVVADDVMAGIYACLAFHAIRFGLAHFGMHYLG